MFNPMNFSHARRAYLPVLSAICALLPLASTLAAAAGPEGPFRLTRERWAEAQTKSVEPLVIPLDTLKVSNPASGKLTENSLLLEESARQHVILINQPVNAEDYNVLRVEMRVDGGEQCRLNWVTALDPDRTKNPGAMAPIFADNAFHTYTIPLRTPALTWNGVTQQLLFFPAYREKCTAEIKRIAFDYVPPDAPHRRTIRGETLTTTEILPAPVKPWAVTVPPGGVFETELAVTSRAWGVYKSDGVRFMVVLQTADGESDVLVSETLDPVNNERHRRPVRVRRDVSDFAGEEVTLNFGIDHLDQVTGDYALWGNPVVYGAGDEAGATPVILISLDTVRAQHMSVHGFERETTPHLEAWASDAVVFENAIAQDDWTLPSHMTMLTGLYPKHHGVTKHAHLGETVQTLPEVLSDAGYLTAAFTSIVWWLEAERGFAQGFDIYDTPRPYRHGFDANEAAFGWMEAHEGTPFFMFLHNYDAHSKSTALGYKLPYRPDVEGYRVFSSTFEDPPGFTREGMGNLEASNFMIAANEGKLMVTERENDFLRALYHDAIRSVDGAVEAFLSELKARGLYDNALIILTSDHGESFGEHGRWMHEVAYESCAHVPLMVKFPGNRFGGKRFSPMVQLTDLFPTVLDVLNIEADAPTDGVSLLALLEERTGPITYGYTRRHVINAVRTNEWKLFHNPVADTYELYKLSEDPNEQNNLVEEHPEKREELKTVLHDFYAPARGGWHFDFRAGKDAAREFTLRLSTDDRIRTAAVFEQSGGARVPAKITEEGRMVEVTVSVEKGGHVDYVVRPVSATARCVVEIEADGAFASNLRAEDKAGQAQVSVVLGPEDRPPREHETYTAPEGQPAVVAWYVEPRTVGAAARDLTPEEIQELEALGYLQ